ncbi:RHH-type proline utilization regulon transcriptional repressor/proline dehydrogenase/delta 1-pyrroline-5-carboxylate dehydrogenase [Rhodoblastus acidophilus]|uniref:bifunctional proline dehydrogenase/L-glutamate gamma-semialdehyde dehydrogenase PutA n=1 Tax=Rhodoblastus acidophilus TaxID=1074 RepID=UPI002224729F|nr:bifunctional proline dehydrogenase/L-glutamate gamma-semialdehyde dehydrogenase PutA [Rhodoblastus acidophilus]MCW2286731.1 RHH-type proline utilization regulon transcriptional repressor/proline dehydrogenase/delta 1-pyrroline-5-carboxylate dehydrogenase [Rhodoblastus acidophilus]MCW2335562.1 RHH-type proline utilization regulon transcriptional repressor/proline dehydrogenase/delta 1-pyrroline-5-carboxylate dehydrogenase [Rhodoblastus acidophilus]
MMDAPSFRAAYAPPDEDFLHRFRASARDEAEAERALARDLVRAVRAKVGGVAGVEAFLQEFKLSSREGLAIMALAESLVRAPDTPTADLLLADKLAAGDFGAHRATSEQTLIQACAFALGVSSRLVQADFSAHNLAAGVALRLGAPALRAAARQTIKVLGGQFVFAETIAEAFSRTKKTSDLHSFDMLGEGARTREDAARYFDAYAQAIVAVGEAAQGDSPRQRPGVSVKLSALHPRYEALSRERVLAELPQRVLELARLARDRDLGLTVDAEEADRLELSLEIFGRVLADPSLRGWEGFGLAVQAYQKRALALIDHLQALAGFFGRRLMVRLVKGAYWDTEIKRAQERGLADYPVFTRKAMTDLNFLACAEKLLAAPALYPQFATHNAVTAAALLSRAGAGAQFEFQRLHGMGEALHSALRERAPCRVYAPVGAQRDLLAYLARRLIENGANASFVARVADRTLADDALLADPLEALADGRARHASLRKPDDIYLPLRRNSRGVEFGCSADLAALLAEIAPHSGRRVDALPSVACRAAARPRQSPVDGEVIGTVVEADEEAADRALSLAQAAFPAWRATPVEQRARLLEAAADAFEARRGRLIALLQDEAGKTLDDALAEVREAADLCRTYATQARRLCATKTLPAVAGESNRYERGGRGLFVCISPWNFPLAIFVGQIAAALATGNCVLAKPAEQTPLIAREAVDILLAAGVPSGVLQFLPGSKRLGAFLVGDARIGGVVFTGSLATARAIQTALAQRAGGLIPLIAETGGVNAMIVDSTALLEQVTDDVLTSAFRSAGQRCSALRLLCLQEDIAQPALDMLIGAARELKVGDPRKICTHVGPVIDAEAKAKLDAAISGSAGHALFAGAAPAGSFVAPHIVRIGRPRDLTSEIFGPVLHVTTWRADKFSALLDEIASTGFGLTLGLHTRIERRIAEFFARAPAGNLYVNRNMIGAVPGAQPFGGHGLSGSGPKAGGPDYLRRFLRETTMTVNTAAFGGDAGLLALDD